MTTREETKALAAQATANRIHQRVTDLIEDQLLSELGDLPIEGDEFQDLLEQTAAELARRLTFS